MTGTTLAAWDALRAGVGTSAMRARGASIAREARAVRAKPREAERWEHTLCRRPAPWAKIWTRTC